MLRIMESGERTVLKFKLQCYNLDIFFLDIGAVRHV